MIGGREGGGRARPLSSIMKVQGKTFQKTLPLPLGAEIKIIQSPLVQIREDTKLGLSMKPRSVHRRGSHPERHHQSRGGEGGERVSCPRLLLVSRIPLSYLMSGGGPRLCSSEGRKRDCPGGPPGLAVPPPPLRPARCGHAGPGPATPSPLERSFGEQAALGNWGESDARSK